jgi:carbonic anhydrase
MSSNSLRSTGRALALTTAVALGACTQPAPEPTPVPPPTPPQPKTTAVAAPTTPHWDYGTEHGPASWASLSPEFATCASGKSQSPIDIAKARTERVTELRASYTPAELRVVHHEHVADGINNGHTIQVNYTGADTLTLGDESFKLLQYHFHSPSENTVDGKHFPMEMHLVHKSDAGKLAVLGVFIEEGSENPAYAPVWSNLPKQKGMEFHLEHVQVNVDDLLPAQRSSYRFDGSLTTPPCSEGVKWVVLAQPAQLSAAQIAAFRAVIHDNNRPTQPLNGRRIVTDRVKDMTAR